MGLCLWQLRWKTQKAAKGWLSERLCNWQFPSWSHICRGTADISGADPAFRPHKHLLHITYWRGSIRLDGPLHFPQPGDFCIHGRKRRGGTCRCDGQMLFSYGRAHAEDMACYACHGSWWAWGQICRRAAFCWQSGWPVPSAGNGRWHRRPGEDNFPCGRRKDNASWSHAAEKGTCAVRADKAAVHRQGRGCSWRHDERNERLHRTAWLSWKYNASGDCRCGRKGRCNRFRGKRWIGRAAQSGASWKGLSSWFAAAWVGTYRDTGS